MDLLSLLPSELHEILFYSIDEPGDLLRLYEAGYLGKIFVNNCIWTNKLINNFPLVSPMCFPVLSNDIVSRICQYRMMVLAYYSAYITINDLDELFLSYDDRQDNLKDDQILFLGQEENDYQPNCHINNLDFLGLPAEIMRKIHISFIKGGSLLDISIGKRVKDIREYIGNYHVNVKISNQTRSRQFVEPINFSVVVTLYFLASLPEIKGIA
jgi:hypothetical protein